MNNWIEWELFENTIKGLNKKLYNVYKAMRFTEDGKAYVAEWAIFSKGVIIDDYFDNQNPSLIGSLKGNTFEDLKKFMEENGNETR